MQEQKMLADVKVGDEVALRQGISEDYHLLTVKEISRGIITLMNGERYRVANGTPMAKGDRWYRPSSIEPVTDRIRQIRKKARLVSKLSALNHNDWKGLDIETLEAIAAIIWKDLPK